MLHLPFPTSTFLPHIPYIELNCRNFFKSLRIIDYNG